MSRTFAKLSSPAALGLLLSGLLLSCLLLWAPLAQAGPGDVRTVNGVAFYQGDPGPVTDPFWTSGQYKYDPHGYMDINRWDTGVHVNTVYAQHAGGGNCVFRKRVIVDDWDSRHPFLRVCRRPE